MFFSRIGFLNLQAPGPGGRRRCIEAGMDDYLQKPVRREDLAEALAKWIPLAAPAAQDPAWREEFHRELLECFKEDSPEKLRAMEKALAARPD